MKILHCCLSCFYIDGYSYQENELIREHVQAGHDVLVLASTESFDETQKKTYLNPGEYIGNEGAKVIRLPFARWLPSFFMKKIKAYQGFLELLESYKPNVIMFHGIGSFELLTVSKYKKRNQNITLYADTHADYHNSAKNFISRNILHKFLYKLIIQNSLTYISKILYISIDSAKFSVDHYKIPESKLEFYPLGGHLYKDTDYFSRRNSIRKEYDLHENNILFLQTGKFDKKKKLIDSLRAFSHTKNPNFRFFIVGSFIDANIENLAHSFIKKDERVNFIGWKDSEIMKNFLCAADIYVQPGSQSATMQMSLCARCPVILDNVESHRIFIKGNGWLLNNSRELMDAFKEIESNTSILSEMSLKSFKVAKKILDYKKLAMRITS